MKQQTRTPLPPEEKEYYSVVEISGSQPQPVESNVPESIIPPRPKRRPVKRKFIAGLFSAVFPGAGHLYLGLLRKGITFLFAIILDIAALLYFSSIGMQINVPLLILLALLIPAVYFYNVYDALQAADRIIRYPKNPSADQADKLRRTRLISEPGISFGLFLLSGGVLLFLFRLKPVWLQYFIEHYAGSAIGIILAAGGLLLALREFRLSRARRIGGVPTGRRIGRYTACWSLIGVGILLFRDWLLGTEDMLLLLKWWPAVPVIWGLEYLLSYFGVRRRRFSREGGRTRFLLDIKGLLPALLLGASVFIVAEQEHYLQLWNKVSLNLTAASVDYGEAKGGKFVKPAVTVPVELTTAKLSVDAINGDILVHRSAVKDIQVTATVWVDQLEGARAQAVADQSFIEVTEGPAVKLTTKGKAYGESGKRQPRIDLDISVPDNRRFNLQITTMNGGITLQNVEAIEDIQLQTGNGPIILHQVFGSVKGKTLNGEVRVRDIEGNVDLSTNGGDMQAWDVSSALKLETAVGNIRAERSGAEVKLLTKNGNVDVVEARSALDVQSLNGIVDVRSSSLQGNWDIYSAVGDINLYLPENANFTLKGSSGYGNIISGFPGLTIDKKTITGQVGTGEFKVNVEGNSNLNVRKQ